MGPTQLDPYIPFQNQRFREGQGFAPSNTAKPGPGSRLLRHSGSGVKRPSPHSLTVSKSLCLLATALPYSVGEGTQPFPGQFDGKQQGDLTAHPETQRTGQQQGSQPTAHLIHPSLSHEETTSQSLPWGDLARSSASCTRPDLAQAHTLCSRLQKLQRP